jgi:exopolysaccharide biosynthesis protein
MRVAPCLAASVTTYPFQGVTLIHRTETSPRNLDIHVALIDTLAPGISFATTPESPYSNDMVIAQTTRAFMTQVGAQLAINGDFYSSPGSFGGFPHRDPTTFAASAGNIYSPFVVGRPAINIQKNNVAHTVVASGSSTAGKLQPNPAVPVWNAVGGWDYLLNNGTQPGYITNPNDSRYAFANALHPRTAMGISADRRTIAMFVVDGRQSDSGGMNFPEMASMLKNDYGMHWAINLDGGGSTTMAIADSSPRVLNDPSDGSERPVGNSWAVFARPTPPPIPPQAVAKVFQQQTGVYQHGGAEIRSAAPTSNYANTNSFRVGYDTSQGKSRGVLSFDLSAIGQSSTIHSISLTIDAFSSAGATGFKYVDLELHKLASQTN